MTHPSGFCLMAAEFERLLCLQHRRHWAATGELRMWPSYSALYIRMKGAAQKREKIKGVVAGHP